MLAFFDNWLVRAMFGAGFPIGFVLLAWEPMFSFGGEERHVRFALSGHGALSCVAASAVMLMAWSFAGLRGGIWNRLAAIALGLGSALAALYSCGFLVLLLRIAVFTRSAPSDALQLLVLVLAIAIPALSSAIFFRQAVAAWTATETRAARRPILATLVVTIGAMGTCALGVSLYFLACSNALNHLRSDQPDAVERSVFPLRVAVVLGGEDRLLRLAAGEDEFVWLRFNQAFRHVMGHTAEQRSEEIID